MLPHPCEICNIDVNVFTLEEQDRVCDALSFWTLHCCIQVTGNIWKHLLDLQREAFLQSVVVVTEDLVIL